MTHVPHKNEFFDIYYDIGETLFDRIRDAMDRYYEDSSRTPDNLAALKSIRESMVQAVATMEQIKPESIYRELEEIRSRLSADELPS